MEIREEIVVQTAFYSIAARHGLLNARSRAAGWRGQARECLSGLII